MQKKYGIIISLPETSTMLSEHLLGENWHSYRWFDNVESRDNHYLKMQEQPSNYREGDTIQQQLEKVDR